MISKTHTSAQQPRGGRQLNAKVCGCKSAIYLILSSLRPLCSNNDNSKTVQVLTVILSQKLMLTTAWNYMTTQCLHSSEFTLVDKVVHSTGWLLSRGGSAGIRNLYSYVTSSGDIRYDNRSYAAIVQRKSRVRGQISAPSVPSCVCANELSFKICVFQVVKSPQSRRDRC